MRYSSTSSFEHILSMFHHQNTQHNSQCCTPIFDSSHPSICIPPSTLSSCCWHYIACSLLKDPHTQRTVFPHTYTQLPPDIPPRTLCTYLCKSQGHNLELTLHRRHNNWFYCHWVPGGCSQTGIPSTHPFWSSDCRRKLNIIYYHRHRRLQGWHGSHPSIYSNSWC